MSDRLAADQIFVLEALVVQLVRALHRTGTLSDDDRDQILNSVLETSSSERGTAFIANHVVGEINPSHDSQDISEAGASLIDHIREVRRIYGREPD